MTWHVSRSAPAALLLATAVLTGCATAVQPQASLTPTSASPSGPALARAEAVARSWADSPAALHSDHDSDHGSDHDYDYDPLDVPNVWLPPDGFHSAADASAYQADKLDLRATLPYSPETGTVRWTDGSTLTLPLVPVGRLIKEPPPAASCPVPDGSCPAPPTRPSGGNPGCPSHQCPGWLVVTAVVPGTREIDTSRGAATIPIWQLTIAGYQAPFSYPAVATPLPTSPSVPGLTPVSRWTGLSPDGRTLTAHQEGGGCRQPLPGEVYETDSAVVLIGRDQAHTGSDPCPLYASLGPVTFHLTHPLGTRAVLDAATGLPLPRTPVQPGGPISPATP